VGRTAHTGVALPPSTGAMPVLELSHVLPSALLGFGTYNPYIPNVAHSNAVSGAYVQGRGRLPQDGGPGRATMNETKGVACCDV